jgi:UDP-glucose 4-epimerase
VVAIFCGQLLGGVQPRIFGDGTKTRDYVYVGDVAAANMLAMSEQGDGEVLNLARGVEVSDLEIFEAVRDALGVDVEPEYALKRPGEAERVSLDAIKASTVLGWTPSVELEDGIRKTADYWRRSAAG